MQSNSTPIEHQDTAAMFFLPHDGGECNVAKNASKPTGFIDDASAPIIIHRDSRREPNSSRSRGNFALWTSAV
jgi:hypothetical protein